YELLTGTTPFGMERFRHAGYDEVCRIIREEEPPRPSARLSAVTDSLPALAAQRQMEPSKLKNLLRGELDWIVMKALEKDRNRRYETASGLARDIERYLTHQPVAASPPSRLYRLRKFVQRNRRGVAATAVAAAGLVAGVIGLAIYGLEQSHLARQQE